MLPLRYADELREMPENIVSSNAANEQVSLYYLPPQFASILI